MIHKAAHERPCAKLVSTTIARGLMGQCFTLSEQQGTYETVLGRPLDKRNFRKKLIGSGIVRPTGKLLHQAVGRPGQLYRFAASGLEPISIRAARCVAAPSLNDGGGHNEPMIVRNHTGDTRHGFDAGGAAVQRRQRAMRSTAPVRVAAGRIEG
jgi:hypothetical protein